MKQLKVFFTDFWPGFDVNDNFLVKRLQKSGYEVLLNSNPDYLFCSSFGRKHMKFADCIKIFYTGENDTPDFNLYDYAIAFQHIVFEDRYLRFPLYLLYGDLYNEIQSKYFKPEQVLNRKFCNFVYSNSKFADPFREKFFKELLKYKKVDSGGRYLNNIGGPVVNKLDFIKDYKFTIAFENSSLSGYTTEKILEPMSVNSLPIYWGDPAVSLDFNSNSFINVNEYSSIEAAVEEVIRIDSNDDLYLEILNRAWLKNPRTLDDWFSSLDAFLCNIFEQPKSKAKRCTEYGYVRRSLKKSPLVSILGKFL